MGYLLKIDPDLGKIEADTVSCKHCQALIKIHKGKREEGGFCMQCMAPLCVACAKLEKCTPFLQKIEKQLTRQARRSALPV